MRAFVWFDGRQATGMMGFPQVFVENKALEVKLLTPLFSQCRKLPFRTRFNALRVRPHKQQRSGRMILW